MWAARVIFRFPCRDFPPRVEQVPEPACVQTFVAELAVKTFHAAVLRRLARLDVNDVDLPLNGPGKKVPRSHLRAVVTANRLRLSVYSDGPFEFARHAPA